MTVGESQLRGARRPKVYKGETIAGGVALGPVFLQGFEEEAGFPQRIPADQVEGELNRLRSALDRSRSQIDDLKAKHGDTLGENELRIFDVHIAYLQDPMFVDEIERLVLRERYSVRAALRKIVNDYDRIFQLVEDDYLRQRAGDFRDVATRLNRNLKELAQPEAPIAKPPSDRYVLAARRLTVNDLFKLDNERVEGIVTEQGGISSHAGILARSMGIPTLSGVTDILDKLSDGQFVILDASSGELHVDPDERLRAEFAETAQRLSDLQGQMPSADAPHNLRDGTKVEILASCGSTAEVELSRTFGMDGIGLYRTELLFLIDSSTPSEELLFEHYREVLRQPQGVRKCIRLLDVTSTQHLQDLRRRRERNPALGMRGVRALLEDGKILRLQLRAILRAAAKVEQVAILVPFVTGVSDLQRVRTAVIEERLELRKRDIPCAETLEIAPIIEVPAAAFVLHAFLNEADFVVVAIDDLQALLLAADRDEQHVREYYEAMHPALFELVARMAREAGKREKDLILFGEGAADPDRVPFYLGVGVRAFSVAPTRLNGMLRTLSRFTIDECRKISDRLLEAPRAVDVQRVIVRMCRKS